MRSLSLLVVAALLSGCASNQYRIPVGAQAKSEISTSRVLVAVEQKEIDADYVPVVGGAVSGVIAGLPGIGILAAAVAGGIEGGVNAKINSDRADEAKAIAAPVARILEGYDFGGALKDTVDRELHRVAWLKATSAEIHRSPIRTPADRDQLVAGTHDSALLLLKTRYSLAPGLTSLRVVCEATLIARDPRLKSLVEQGGTAAPAPLYQNRFRYSRALPDAGPSPQQAAAAWSADHGKLIRAALAEATAEISKMIALDIDSADIGANPKAPGDAVVTIQYEGMTGTPLTQTDTRTVLRLANGELASIPRPGTEPAAGPQRVNFVTTSPGPSAAAPGNSAVATNRASDKAPAYPRVLTGAEIASHFASHPTFDTKVGGLAHSLTVGPGDTAHYECTICITRLGRAKVTLQTAESLICFDGWTGSRVLDNGCYQVVQTSVNGFELQGVANQETLRYVVRSN